MTITTKMIETRLKELLTYNQSFGIAINGKWGVGKTVFWNKFVEENFSDKSKNGKKVAYISLFGQETIQQIKNDLLLQIYTQNGFVKKIKDKVGSFKLYGMDISLALSWFEKKDFENVIICFDDFERISDRLKLKDILGLISELKEQKKCTVVMILNKDELKDVDLSKYKDKIVDFDFNYEPTVAESFALINDSLKTYEKYPFEYFQKHGINNIRIMKRVINALNDYACFEESLREYKDIERELVENILEISTINALDLSVNFEKLSKYSMQSFLDKKTKNKNEDYEKSLKYINFGYSGYFHMSDITYNVIDYVKNSIVDKESLQKSIDERIEKQKYSLVEKQIREYTHKARYDLHYSFDKYIQDLFTILESHKNTITEILNADNFLFYIQQLKEFDRDNEQKYNTFAIDILKKYLDIELLKENKPSWVNQTINNIKNFDALLADYYDNFESSTKNEKISSLESVKNLMLNPIKNSSWGEEPNLLAQVRNEDLEQYLYQSMSFVDDSLTFLHNSISKYGNFEIFRNKLLDVIKNINQTGNKDQQIKIKKILEYLKEE